MNYDNEVLKELKPITSRKYINKHKSITALKIFLVILFSMFINFFLDFALGIVNTFSHLNINISGPLRFIAVAFVLWVILDFILIKYLSSVRFRIYNEKISYSSTFPIYFESEIYIDDIVSVSTFQLPYEKAAQSGSITLSRQYGRPMPIFLIQDMEQIKKLIKSLMKQND